MVSPGHARPRIRERARTDSVGAHDRPMARRAAGRITTTRVDWTAESSSPTLAKLNVAGSGPDARRVSRLGSARRADRRAATAPRSPPPAVRTSPLRQIRVSGPASPAARLAHFSNRFKPNPMEPLTFRLPLK
jgi:hypothetical protein